MLKIFLLALCSVGCVFTLISQDRPSTSADRDSDSDEVYAAVVNWRTAHPGERPKAKQLIFLNTTVRYSCLGEKPEDCATKVREQLTRAFGRDLELGVLSDYFEHNKDRGPLSKSIPTDLPKSWLSDADEEALFKSKKRDGWESSMPSTLTRAASWRFRGWVSMKGEIARSFTRRLVAAGCVERATTIC